MRYGPEFAFLGALRALRFTREDPKNSNRSQPIDAFLRFCGSALASPWCMAIVSYVGVAVFGAPWPLPATGSTQQAATVAKRAGLVVPIAEARAGDLVLLWSEPKQRVHHAFVLEAFDADTGTWRTLEGNTNDDGSAEGWRFMSRKRELHPKDVIVRWTAGLPA